MLSAGTSILSQLSTISQGLASSVSSDEKITLMEELISMLSSITTPTFEDQELVSSMSRDTIRMSSLVDEHQRRCGIMQRKMATLWRGGLSDQVEGDFLQLATSGLNSLMLKIEMSFSALLNNFALEISFAHSLHSELMPTGVSHLRPKNTNLHQAWCLTRAGHLSLMNGYETILRDTHLE